MNRMTRFISLLLAASLLCLGAGGALAETATEPALNFKVLPGLMEGQQANPAERNIFDKPEEVAAAFDALSELTWPHIGMDTT